MSITDPYAPKRNPAAEIVDLKPPAFLQRQDQKVGPYMRSPENRPGLPPPISYEVEAPPQPPKPAPRPPSDLEQIAAWIERLTWTDMKALASAILTKQGENAGPLSATQLGDMFEAWAAETMKQHPDREIAA